MVAQSLITLTTIEDRVLRHLAGGLNTKESAMVLGVPWPTTRAAALRLRLKFNAATLARVVSCAYFYGLLDPETDYEQE